MIASGLQRARVIGMAALLTDLLATLNSNL
jgi:hypothetical protein